MGKAIQPRSVVRDHGFTLVETMVALSIFVAVMTLIFGQLTSGVQRTSDIDQATMANTSARLVLEALTVELRQASTGDTALPTIPQLASSAITFYTPDRSDPMHLNKVSYRLNGTVLERRAAASTNTGSSPWIFPTTTPTWIPVLSGLVNTNLFTFHGASGAAVTDSGSVRVIVVHFVLGSGLTNPVQIPYNVEVSLRISQ